MWLVNTETFQRQDFVGANIPRYAILSHTWGAEEIAFQDFEHQLGTIETERGVGFKKIKDCCRQAKSDSIEWVWVDTCCIDKRSSAELTEAINSMFTWYRNAQVCYAYLADVSRDMEGNFEHSAWFTRGWTLQELIAPPFVSFYDQDWCCIGCKITWSGRAKHTQDARIQPIHVHDKLSRITNISKGVLENDDAFFDVSVAQRMSWASSRTTTREEDLAYCLMGLFGVSLPILYGEGLKKAFRRLQLEIMSQTADQSIFAWDYSCSRPDADPRALLAESPFAFAHSSRVSIWGIKGHTRTRIFEMTNSGLRVSLLLLDASSPTPLALLECGVTIDGDRKRITIPLELCQGKQGGSPPLYIRQRDVSTGTLKLMTWDSGGLTIAALGAKTEDVIIMESPHYLHWRRLMLYSNS